MSKFSLFTALAYVMMVTLCIPAQSSTPLPTGTVTVDLSTPTCPTSAGWLSGVTCKHAFVTCPESNGSASLGITYGYKTPGSGTINGTIVIFSHSGGITPEAFPGSEGTIAGAYYGSNYQVVQTQWDSDWEDESSAGTGGSIGLAACRPATFLQWVITTLFATVYKR
jgi:hypothetical protein